MDREQNWTGANKEERNERLGIGGSEEERELRGKAKGGGETLASLHLFIH